MTTSSVFVRLSLSRKETFDFKILSDHTVQAIHQMLISIYSPSHDVRGMQQQSIVIWKWYFQGNTQAGAITPMSMKWSAPLSLLPYFTFEHTGCLFWQAREWTKRQRLISDGSTEYLGTNQHETLAYIREYP